jgi:hypothetical protein
VRASEKLANSPLAGDVLAGLSKLGMVGIGLIPTQPRQILSTRPLFAPSSFDGVPLRIINDPQTAALVSALGARPVQNVTAGGVQSSLQSGSIGAVETSATPIVSNSYNAVASYLTSYAVMPKFETIVATQSAWASLTVAQQAAIRDAAINTLVNSSQVRMREASQLSGLCKSGVILDQPSASQLAALAQEADRAAPVSPAATAIMRQIRSTIPGAGPQPTALPADGCFVAHTPAQAKAQQRLFASGGGGSGNGLSIPAGTYVTTTTLAEEVAGDVTNPELQRSVTWTWHIYANRKVKVTTTPYMSDQWNTGHYVATGRNQVTFIWTGGSALTPETVRWSYFDGQLTFAVVHVQDANGRILYTDHPWRRVG